MKNKIIAVIGAGGKTTLIHRLAEEYRRKGASVLVSTTTHMLVEPDTDLSCDSFAVMEKIKKTGYCMAGAVCLENSAKMQSLPEQMLHDLMKQVDYALIEADGAKHYALKYPSEQEPVIPEGTTDVILVLGSWDLGKPCKDVVFRFEHMTSALGISGDMKADKQMLQWIWQAYEEKLKNMDYQGHFHVLLSEKTDQGLVFHTLKE